jgi:hypothetical protein
MLLIGRAIPGFPEHAANRRFNRCCAEKFPQQCTVISPAPADLLLVGRLALRFVLVRRLALRAGEKNARDECAHGRQRNEGSRPERSRNLQSGCDHDRILPQRR